jgi:hypothetical protein
VPSAGDLYLTFCSEKVYQIQSLTIDVVFIFLKYFPADFADFRRKCL